MTAPSLTTPTTGWRLLNRAAQQVESDWAARFDLELVLRRLMWSGPDADWMTGKVPEDVRDTYARAVRRFQKRHGVRLEVWQAEPRSKAEVVEALREAAR